VAGTGFVSTGGGAAGGSAGFGQGGASDECPNGDCPPPPSCRNLADTCGPQQDDACCTHLAVGGGTYFRSNDPYCPATISDFALDKYEVSVGRFRSFLADFDSWRAEGHPKQKEGANPKAQLTGWGETSLPYELAGSAAELAASLDCNTAATWTDVEGDADNLPINCITWFEAFAFCIWDGGRLPSEAEWNYAAAGGDEQRQFPWGSTEPLENAELAVHHCHFVNDSACTRDDVAPVGSIPAGAGLFGQLDLAGNLWEWGFDAYNANTYGKPYFSPCVDCAVAAVDVVRGRSLRGGSWLNPSLELLNATRGEAQPESRAHDHGVRCARDN
jgi:formylglycine-generating enzyme